MTGQKRLLPSLFALFLGITAAGPSQGQAPAGTKKHTLRDFDIREQAAARAPAKIQGSQALAAVERRRGIMESFLAASRAGRPGIRIAPNRYGLPKLLLRDGGTLSGASTLEPEEIARNFLRAHSSIFPFGPGELDGLRVVVKDVAGDATFLAFNQTLNGIDVFNAQIKVTLTKSGEVVQVATGDVIPELSTSTNPRLSYEQAIQRALRSSGSKAPVSLSRIFSPNRKVAFRNPNGARYSPITSELVIFPMDATSGRLAYRVFVDTDPQSWYEILIDAESGGLLFRHNLYVHAAQGNVWVQSPMVGTRQMVAFPDGWLPASPNGPNNAGWLTTGNNGDAFIDSDGDDQADHNNAGGLQGGRAYGATGVFDFPFGDGTLAQDPRNFPAAAVTNLFYLVNTAHDYYYGLGFTESAGNLQTDNFGKGGLGHDAVLAEAQQGNETDNSSFASTPDGTAPRMRVGLRTRGTSSYLDDLDYDYDGQTIIHEYGHGVSNRLVGAGTSTSCLSGIQSGALGEGWSDYFAVSFFNNPVLDAYSSQNATTGMRRQSYEGYTFTYEDIGNGDYGYEVHDDGEIWAGALWDLRKSLGQSVTDHLVLNGLKSTQCSPSMTDARDAILSADQAANAGANRAKIWQVFARHGLGYSAYGADGSTVTGSQYDAAYDQPPDLQLLKNPAITSNPLAITGSLGSPYSYTVTATNPNAGKLNFALTSGPKGMTVDPVSGKVTWVASFTGQRVKITVTDAKGGKVVHGFELPVYTDLTLGSTVTIGGLHDSTGCAGIRVPAHVTVLQVTLRGGTGDAELVVMDPDGNFDYSMRDGNNETLSYAFPTPGFWPIVVYGSDTYSEVSLTASLITPSPLSAGTTLSNMSALESSESLYRVTIPAGVGSFQISTSGGSGDVDLYLSKGVPALCQTSWFFSQFCSYDEGSHGAGNKESITVNNPDSGDWYVDLSAYEDYSGVTLVTALTQAPALIIGASSLSFTAAEAGQAPAPQNLAVSNPAGGAYDWTAQAATSSGGSWLLIDKSSGTGDATIQVSADPTGLQAGTYQGSIKVIARGLAGSPLTIQVTLTVMAGLTVPAIAPTGVVNGASFQPSIVAGSWVTIMGTNFTTITDTWEKAIVNGKLPKVLDGVSVSIGGKAAFIYYISPTQINAQAPDVGAGSVPVTVTNPAGASVPITATVVQYSPAFFLWAGKYAVATRQDYSLAVAPGTFPGAATMAAKPGEVLILWATGLGPTDPPVPAGIQAPGDRLYSTGPVEVTIGSVQAQVYGSALSPGFAGLYQVAIQVPGNLAHGDYQIKATIGGASSPGNVYLTVKQ